MGPIGVFDSGYGGLTILQDLRNKLPEYDYLYLGDNARAPYGTRSFDVVYEFTYEAVRELFDRGCHLVILACNTASAKALRTIQQKDLPTLAPNKRVLGVIRPSAEVIGSITKTGHVGVLATEGTVRSNSYFLELQKLSPETIIEQHACPMWVPLIENDRHTSEAGKMFIKEDLDQLLDKDPQIDTILLGCTHYPILKEFIESYVPKNIHVVSQGAIVAESLADYLMRHPEIERNCTKNSNVDFLTSENVEIFNRKATQFFDSPVHASHVNLGLKFK
ncbi:MAG: glutamate racemase [Bacteroidetes bacterium]|nr:MAG: glutamate racemase [Bacteroidota bacterium]